MPIDPTLLATLKTKSPDQQNVIKYMVLPHTGCGKKSEWSDVDFDLHVNTALKTQSGEQMAIDALGIDIDDCKEIEPVHFWDYKMADAYCLRRVDGSIVSSRIQDTWLFFSDEQMYIYSKDIWLDEDKKTETADEYFYKDVTNVSVKSTEEKPKSLVTASSGGCSKPQLAIQSQTLTSDKFTIVVPGASLELALYNKSEINAQIQAVRAKLREKKRG